MQGLLKLPIILGIAAAVALVLALAPAAAQVTVGAGHRTDQTPLDRQAENTPREKTAPEANADPVFPAEALPPVRYRPPVSERPHTDDPVPRADRHAAAKPKSPALAPAG